MNKCIFYHIHGKSMSLLMSIFMPSNNLFWGKTINHGDPYHRDQFWQSRGTVDCIIQLIEKEETTNGQALELRHAIKRDSTPFDMLFNPSRVLHTAQKDKSTLAKSMEIHPPTKIIQLEIGLTRMIKKRESLC